VSLEILERGAARDARGDLENGVVQEAHIERTSRARARQQSLQGTRLARAAGMQAAFVEIGLGAHRLPASPPTLPPPPR
jgi:hypothetical protein